MAAVPCVIQPRLPFLGAHVSLSRLLRPGGSLAPYWLPGRVRVSRRRGRFREVLAHSTASRTIVSQEAPGAPRVAGSGRRPGIRRFRCPRRLGASVDRKPRSLGRTAACARPGGAWGEAKASALRSGCEPSVLERRRRRRGRRLALAREEPRAAAEAAEAAEAVVLGVPWSS